MAEVIACDAGGKGVNISRALTVNGVKNTALVVLGKENGEKFRHALEADGISYRQIAMEGRIRENLTLHTDNAPETRISFAGFSAGNELIDRVEAELDALLEEGSILTFTGRNPGGVGLERVKSILKKFGERGVKIVLDSRSFGKQDMIDVRPWLIKPNEEEIELYTGAPVRDFGDARRAAEELRNQGIENVMISLGGEGALLCCAAGCYVARAPQIDVRSTIGAGDSMIGGFCAATMLGLSPEDTLRYAVAYGSAACMSEGSRPPHPENTQALLSLVAVEMW